MFGYDRGVASAIPVTTGSLRQAGSLSEYMCIQVFCSDSTLAWLPRIGSGVAGFQYVRVVPGSSLEHVGIQPELAFRPEVGV